MIDHTGSLFQSTATYLVHQCNCTSRYGKGLSKSMFQHYPYANRYATRHQPDLPGTISIHGSGAQRKIINMYAQRYPGKANGTDDTSESRIWAFNECLLILINLHHPLFTYAFPHGIGCGLAGGDWDKYERLLDKFADAVGQHNVEIWRMEVADE